MPETQIEELEDSIEGSSTHFCDLVTSRDPKRSLIKGTKETKEGLCNNVGLDSAQDPLKCNTIQLTHLAG